MRYLFSLPAAMFYTFTAAGLHGSLGSPPGPSAIAAAFASYLFLTSIGLWVLSDAERQGRVLPYDYGSFIFFGFFVVVPLYLWWTRRWRAVVPLGIFILLCVAAIFVASVPQWL
jgi:hypothetical protein